MKKVNIQPEGLISDDRAGANLTKIQKVINQSINNCILINSG